MVGSTAENDSEIGARLGVCFTIAGLYFLGSYTNYVDSLLSGVGGLLGKIPIHYIANCSTTDQALPLRVRFSQHHSFGGDQHCSRDCRLLLHRRVSLSPGF